jgi:hypothetical protein
VSILTFTTIIVPAVATLAYFIAGVGNLYLRNYALSGMWFAYSVANVCLLIMVAKK